MAWEPLRAAQPARYTRAALECASAAMGQLSSASAQTVAQLESKNLSGTCREFLWPRATDDRAEWGLSRERVKCITTGPRKSAAHAKKRKGDQGTQRTVTPVGPPLWPSCATRLCPGECNTLPARRGQRGARTECQERPLEPPTQPRQITHTCRTTRAASRESTARRPRAMPTRPNHACGRVLDPPSGSTGGSDCLAAGTLHPGHETGPASRLLLARTRRRLSLHPRVSAAITMPQVCTPGLGAQAAQHGHDQDQDPHGAGR